MPGLPADGMSVVPFLEFSTREATPNEFVPSQLPVCRVLQKCTYKEVA